MQIRRKLALGLVFVALMSPTLLVPAFAAGTEQAVTASGSIFTSLTLSANTGSVSFGNIGLDLCKPATNTVTFTVATNASSISGTVWAEPTNGLSVLQDPSVLFWWKGGTPSCDEVAKGNSFKTQSELSGPNWISNQRPTSGSYSEVDYYAIRAPGGTQPGAFSFSLHYSVQADA